MTDKKDRESLYKPEPGATWSAKEPGATWSGKEPGASWSGKEPGASWSGKEPGASRRIKEPEASWSAKEAVVRELFELTLSLGGTLSGEHGIGLTKARYIDMELDMINIDLMKGIKNLFDPKNILNPGKIFPPDK
ncbi:MAG: hypothetical protein HQL03_14430, partial [Nitrospirae bacterium]|nr:hypothetical protein [Nitrospirota bacterium]